MVSSELSPNINLRYWRIRLQYFPLLAFMGVMVSVISRIALFPNFRIFLADTIMQLVGLSAVYAFWVITARALIRFDKDRLTRVQIMAIGATGGLLMAGSQSLLSWIFDVPLQLSFTMRAIGNVVVAAFWLPLQSVVVGNFRRYAKLKREVRTEILQQESVQFARSRALEEYRRKIEKGIQDNLKLTTSEAQKLFESLKSKGSQRLPEYLRVISDEYFRLTAHKMDSKIKIRQPRFANLRSNFTNFRLAVIESVLTRPLNPGWFATVIVVTIIVPLTAKAEYILIPEIALATGLSAFLVQSTLLSSFKFIKKRQILATLVATAGSIAIPIFIARLIPNNDPKFGNHIAYLVVVITVTCLGHIAQAGILKESELREAAIRDLTELRNTEKEQNAEFSKITRDWAKYIHGNYTTKLEAAALAIETAISTDDTEATEQAIREVEGTLKLDSKRTLSKPQILIDEVQDRCTNWQGLIHINIQSQVRSDISVVASIRDVGDCVEEAILNAVRHGDCTLVEIEITEKESHLSLVITNDGVGFSNKPQGFGSSIYEEATRGDWKLWRDEKSKSTILELNFAKS
ncbi:COG4585 Signal transduction histidine kinase [Candidatus Nanopelagicaceae bacterium]